MPLTQDDISQRVRAIQGAQFAATDNNPNLNSEEKNIRKTEISRELEQIERGLQRKPTKEDISNNILRNPAGFIGLNATTERGNGIIRGANGGSVQIEVPSGETIEVLPNNVNFEGASQRAVMVDLEQQARNDLARLERENNLQVKPPSLPKLPTVTTRRVKTTPASRAIAVSKPVKFTIGETKKSTAFKRATAITKTRLDNELKDSATTDETYEQIFGESNRGPEFKKLKIAEDIALGRSFANADFAKAKRVAQGLDNPPEGISTTGVTYGAYTKAIDNGEHQLASEIIRRHSLSQTRKGQEIAAQRGWYEADESSMLMNTLINQKMHRALEIEYEKGGNVDRSKKGVRAKYKTKIETRAKKAVEDTNKDVALALKIDELFNSLLC